MPEYPNMCRDDHVEIGHRGNTSELCPLCRALARIEELEAALADALDAMTEAVAQLADARSVKGG